MRTGLVVDAFCDLPHAQIEQHGIRVLPSRLDLDNRTWLDERAPEQTMMFFRRFLSERGMAARSAACSALEIEEIFLRDLVLEFDRVLVISACAEFSATFQNATDASYAILQSYRERREEGRRQGSFALRVIDSGSICAGEALAACRALQLLTDGQHSFDQVRRVLRDEVARVTCLLVPGDPWYLRQRGLDGNGASMGSVDYLRARISDLKPVIELAGGKRRILARPRGFRGGCAVALSRVAAAIDNGLGAPVVALSFGGDPRIIREMPAYQDLEARAASARVDLHLAVMSATMGVRLGPGALSCAWLAPSPAG
jgi:fatty acid-binding protein DegV